MSAASGISSGTVLLTTEDRAALLRTMLLMRAIEERGMRLQAGQGSGLVL
jgi:hypothetical protein